MRKLGRGLTKTITTPLNQTRNKAMKMARDEFRSTSPGRSIFGGRGKSSSSGRPPLIVHAGRSARVSESQGGFLVQMVLEGFAALIEKGGRTAPHLIRPKRSSLLRFEGKTGTVFARAVRHPGGPVHKNPIGEKSIQRAFRTFPNELDRSFDQSVREAGLS